MVRVLLLISGMFFWTISQAQTKEETAVYAQLDRLNTAMVERNQQVLAEIYHDQMWYGHSSGKLDDKNAAIKDVMEGPLDFTSLVAEERSIKLVDKNATVRFIFQAKGINNGQEQTIRIGVMMVWVKLKTGWKLLARQAYKL